jgi:hypothetical protein
VECSSCHGPAPKRGCSCQVDRMSPETRLRLQELALERWQAKRDRIEHERRQAVRVRLVRGGFGNRNAIGGARKVVGA